MKKLTTEQRKDLERKLADLTEISENIKRLLNTYDIYSVDDYNRFAKSFVVDPITDAIQDGCLMLKLSTINDLLGRGINIRNDDEKIAIEFIKDSISEREFFIIMHRYKLNDAEYMTYTQLATELDISPSRVKSIEMHAKRIIQRSARTKLKKRLLENR